SGALIAAAVYQRDGMPGLRGLLAVGSSNEALIDALPRLLHVAPADLDRWWRDTAMRPAGGCR
ncbi:MAG: hypothetical protein ACREK8_02925, partial [Gemmatimonadales bacterium]